MGKAELANHPIEGRFLLGGISTIKADWDFKDLSIFLSREAPEWLAQMRESKASGDNPVQENKISNDYSAGSSDIGESRPARKANPVLLPSCVFPSDSERSLPKPTGARLAASPLCTDQVASAGPRR